MGDTQIKSGRVPVMIGVTSPTRTSRMLTLVQSFFSSHGGFRPNCTRDRSCTE
jgi:hypothetical protein